MSERTMDTNEMATAEIARNLSAVIKQLPDAAAIDQCTLLAAALEQRLEIGVAAPEPITDVTELPEAQP